MKPWKWVALGWLGRSALIAAERGWNRRQGKVLKWMDSQGSWHRAGPATDVTFAELYEALIGRPPGVDR